MMIPNVVILAGDSEITRDSRFEKAFHPLGEFVEELSHLYALLKEREVALIIIPGDLAGINRAVMARIRVRVPSADIWGVVAGGDVYDVDERGYDGLININDGARQIKQTVTRIINQKSLLTKFGLIGRSEKMKLVAETIDRIAATDISVLIIGPSGSGKELVARAIHDYSGRRDGRFVAVNCGALAEGILESELFGHEKGAFTGSVGKRQGLFVQADNGTILLDEIGETRPNMQVKLLRVLEDGYFYPVGGDQPVRSNARIVAATNRDLTEAIREGHFREDLYFRLGVIKIVLPPLLDRREDILPLLCHFADREKLQGFSEQALEKLVKYDWPGNVRQLRNFISRMAALHPDREVTRADVNQFIGEQSYSQRHLPVATGLTPEEAGHGLIYRALMQMGSEIKMLRELILDNLPRQTDFETVPESELHEKLRQIPRGTLKDLEKAMIETVLKETGGNRKETARRLDIGERTLYRKLKEYNLN